MSAWTFVAAFAWTLAVELFVLARLAPAADRARVLLAGVAVNCITHPTAFLLAPELGWSATELAVLATETALVASIGLATWPRALAWMLVANAASAAGVLLFR